MDKKQWLERIEENPNNLFIRSSLLADLDNVHWDDTALENTLFANIAINIMAIATKAEIFPRFKL